jgi:hypothetical protein
VGGPRSTGARRADARSRGLRWRAALVAATAFAVLVGGTSLAAATPTHAAEPVSPWRPPVSGDLVRGYVEPTATYGPGHRGVDFAAPPGTPVGAAGRGTVAFAGDVAGTRHVVVSHRGGLRTSYSFLREIRVRVGDHVEAGTILGTSGGADLDSGHAPDVVHFGVRLGDRYLDPLQLFRTRDLSELVRLVPVDGAEPVPAPWARAASAEPTSLVPAAGRPVGPLPAAPDEGGCGAAIPLVGAAVDAVCDAAEWAGSRARDALRAGLSVLAGAGRQGRLLASRLAPVLDDLLDQLGTASSVVRRQLLATPTGRVLADIVEIGERFLEWTRRECATDAPLADGTGGSGHLLMAVAGVDSASRGPNGRTFGLDVAALGYRRDEVHWFSYAADGGRYTADDTHIDLRTAAKRLAAQLRAIDAAEPGREVDLVAHSQGGVVVERFLRFEYDASDPTFPPLGTVVTLASPHQGAPLATSGRRLREHPIARRVLDALDPHLPGPPSAAPNVRQLAEDSRFMRRLRDAPLPEHVELTTIGGTDDVVVPANRIRVPGATQVVVAVNGPNDHTAIHRDPRALQAVRAALEGRPPPCTSLIEGLRGAVEPVLLSRVGHDLGEHLTDLEVG